jgi:hypothetical protein
MMRYIKKPPFTYAGGKINMAEDEARESIGEFVYTIMHMIVIRLQYIIRKI